MDLPIRFPSDAEVIHEEARRFRALSPLEQVREVGEMFELYHLLAAQSQRRQELEILAEKDEEDNRRSIMEFVARHARK